MASPKSLLHSLSDNFLAAVPRPSLKGWRSAIEGIPEECEVRREEVFAPEPSASGDEAVVERAGFALARSRVYLVARFADGPRSAGIFAQSGLCAESSRWRVYRRPDGCIRLAQTGGLCLLSEESGRVCIGCAPDDFAGCWWQVESCDEGKLGFKLRNQHSTSCEGNCLAAISPHCLRLADVGRDGSGWWQAEDFHGRSVSPSDPLVSDVRLRIIAGDVHRGRSYLAAWIVSDGCVQPR